MTALSLIVSKFMIATNTLMLDWSINNVLNNVGNKLRSWGSLLMIIIGIVMIIVGIFKIGQGLISHGKTQVNWVVNILLIIVGALFCAGGAFFRNVLTSSDSNGLGNALSNELTNLGNGDGGETGK